MTISDRSKDVIKSGGEWISSVDLEGSLMAHPASLRPRSSPCPTSAGRSARCAAIVLRPGASASAEELKEFLGPLVAKWWLPERWGPSSKPFQDQCRKFDKRCCVRSTPKMSCVRDPRLVESFDTLADEVGAL